MNTPITGTYEHYKGKRYEVVGIAKHSETLEDLVLYRPLYEQSLAEYWVRPKDMFFEDVTIDGNQIPRFKKIGE